MHLIRLEYFLNSIEQWEANKRCIKLISLGEISTLIIGVFLSLKFGGKYSADIATFVTVSIFGIHIMLLTRYWRCPKCSRVQPFWERNHRAAVGSLSNCVYCCAPFR